MGPKILVVALLLLQTCGTVNTFLPFKAAGYLVSAFTFGLDLYGFIDSFDEEKSRTDDKKYEELKKELSNKIDASTNSIIAKIDLHGRFDRLLEISKYMSALLTDIKFIIESETNETRDENIKRYKDGFKEHEADIQAISRLLTQKVPVDGLSKPLVDVYVEQINCSLTCMQVFEDYYMSLVSNAFAIDITNELFNDIDLSNQTKAFWTNNVEILEDAFELRRTECIDRFPQLVKDDLAGDENATDLQSKNALRYSNRLNSVIFVGNDTDSQIKYLEHDQQNEKLYFSKGKMKLLKLLVTTQQNARITLQKYFRLIPISQGW
ncbi:uncharacterized protein LOC128552522 [Mercenaria mercenaria]|uniref:uncharacterized protein LOC128552522 n=1 Tax=Mercenaria mercenaria TaxID=6596 RepID=UPI00234EE0A9|nr:uncharacterized protein LOC128552522 [Mercenaria mercenaria]